mgnify:CR=1 FL=1
MNFTKFHQSHSPLTAGIAHAAIAAWILGKPMGYVRGSAKEHGRNNRIEGRLEPGAKVVVIEDLISTAGSCIDVVEALREAGAEVLGVVSIFTYGMKKGLDRLEAAGVRNISLSNLDALLEVAVEENYVSADAKTDVFCASEKPSTLPPSSIIAAVKLRRVRVEGS